LKNSEESWPELMESMDKFHDKLFQQIQLRDKFLRRLLDPEDLGWSVSAEVRKKVKQFLTSTGSDNES